MNEIDSECRRVLAARAETTATVHEDDPVLVKVKQR